MKQKRLSSIAELEQEVDSLRALILSRRKHEYQILAKPLFRGHADDSWELATTLERYVDRAFSVQAYNRVLCSAAIAVTSFTERTWNVDHLPNINADYISTPPNYEFMAHARHHGFPTPLLDWTQSLYVALFFAFQDAKDDRDVAIFVYIETLVGGKAGWVGSPTISLLGPYIATHKRHFLQQGQYTIAVEKSNDTWTYCPHSKALAESRGEVQDVIYKFTLPGSLRHSVLTKLHEMNITAFTLLGDENSLMSTLAFKEIAMNNE